MYTHPILVYSLWFTLFTWLVVILSSLRRLIAITLIAALVFTLLVIPPRAAAQAGLIAAIQAVLDVINGVIQAALNAIHAARTAFENLQQTVAFPLQLINQARALVTQMIGQYRGLMRSIFNINLNSATLANPQSLEILMRDHRVNDFVALTQAFAATYRPLPLASDASQLDRNMSDMDDALTLESLKTLKATDSATDLELQAADSIENVASQAAPGSAPFLTAAAVASSVRSQAVTQKMLAAELRQEAVHLAHENELRKHGATYTSQLRGILSHLLEHN